jgi:hypothetical protein
MSTIRHIQVIYYLKPHSQILIFILLVIGLAWSPGMDLRPINVKVALVGPRTHSLQSADDTSRLIFKETRYNILHEESSSPTTHAIKFSLLVKKPASNSNNPDRSNVELVFVRHNLEADSMFASCWMVHKSMIEALIECSVDELTETWLMA